MSQLAAADELRAGTLVRVPLQDLTIPRELHRVTLKGRTLSPAAQALWQTVQDASFHLSGKMLKGPPAGRR